MSADDERGIAIVDRIEGNSVVLEMLEPTFTFEFPLELLPDGIDEGSAVEVDFKKRPDVEKARREEISDLQEELIEKPDEDNNDNP